jgi:hypothetical protein
MVGKHVDTTAGNVNTQIRNIHLVWDGDGNLYGSQNTRHQLGFLNLLP